MKRKSESLTIGQLEKFLSKIPNNEHVVFISRRDKKSIDFKTDVEKPFFSDRSDYFRLCVCIINKFQDPKGYYTRGSSCDRVGDLRILLTKALNKQVMSSYKGGVFPINNMTEIALGAIESSQHLITKIKRKRNGTVIVSLN